MGVLGNSGREERTMKEVNVVKDDFIIKITVMYKQHTIIKTPQTMIWGSTRRGVGERRGR